MEIKEVLTFLSDWKTRQQIEEKFNLSNTRSWHLLKWLEKANEIEKICVRKAFVTNRVWLYKTKN